MRTGQHVEALSTTFGLVASLTVHLAALAYLASATTQYDFDFELTLPTEVEFGLTGEMAMAEAPPKATGSPDPRWGDLAPKVGDSERSTIDAGVPLDPNTDTDTDTGPTRTPTRTRR